MAKSTIGITGDNLNENLSLVQDIADELKVPTERLVVEPDPAKLETDYQLIAGVSALRHHRPDMSSPGYIHGRPLILGPSLESSPVGVVALDLESYRRKPDLLPDLTFAVHRLRRIAILRARGERWLTAESPTSCAHCRQDLAVVDRNGLPWCEIHAHGRPLRYPFNG